MSEAVTFLDRHTNFRMGQPVTSRDTQETTETLRFIKGSDDWELMYSDNEPSIENACYNLGVAWEPCQPGVHSTNAIIENTNLQIVYDVKVTLAAAGLPACLWPYAVAFVCFIHNITLDGGHSSPWIRKFGEEFKGVVLPLGCEIFFLPAPTKYKNSKAAPAMSYGIILGYRLVPGSRWTGQYIVADITDFIGNSLHIDTPGNEFRIFPHLTEQIRLGKRGICFPLKNTYDRVNLTLEGNASALGEEYWVNYDQFGVPAVVHKMTKADIEEPEPSEEVEKINKDLEKSRLMDAVNDDPEVMSMLENPSSGEEEIVVDEEEYQTRQETDCRGVTKTWHTDKHGTRISSRTPDKIPTYTNKEWREIREPLRSVMLEDYKKKKKGKRSGASRTSGGVFRRRRKGR